MHRWSVDEIIEKIKAREVFETVADTYGFTLKVEEYAPYLCGAVHDGHQFRKSLWDNCTHSEYERWYEEDPCTKAMVDSHPVVIAGCDSRFEYDLNREPERAVYEDAWGKALWKTPLPTEEKEESLSKHSDFYRVVHALVSELESIHGKLIVFDMHSYNWKRWERPVPTWNLGTSNVDEKRFGKIIEQWKDMLATLQLPHDIPQTSAINDTFQGNGYFLKYITSNFNDSLVLATEIAKIYCDEYTGIIYPEVVAAVSTQLEEYIPLLAKEFHQAEI